MKLLGCIVKMRAVRSIQVSVYKHENSHLTAENHALTTI